MMNSTLLGRRVRVRISDPWDFVTHNGGERTGVVSGSGVDRSTPIFRIRLDEPVSTPSVVTDIVFASFRHGGVGEPELRSGAVVPCNFSTATSDSESSAEAGAGAFIGALELLP